MWQPLRRTRHRHFLTLSLPRGPIPTSAAHQPLVLLPLLDPCVSSAALFSSPAPADAIYQNPKEPSTGISMSVSLSSAPRILQDLLFLRPTAGRLLPLPGYRRLQSRRLRRLSSRVVVQSGPNERISVTEVSKDLDRYVGNGNGSGGGSGYGYKEVVNGSADGKIEVILNGNEVSNGSASLVYTDGNGAAAEEAKRKTRVEEIGKEDAWFKMGGQQPEVRTSSISGFVNLRLKSKYLMNHHPSSCTQRGMTEEKKASRRKALAKWLKESILRLGPTFIKAGQQFSTRVDILPQEYVDQLSELQVKFLIAH
ncbi:hypothetical protein BHM03_00018204 [Ensete ventricosum]|nr:hypothetical protein BHM03_00018204 [Ensete ventricosum]